MVLLYKANRQKDRFFKRLYRAAFLFTNAFTLYILAIPRRGISVLIQAALGEARRFTSYMRPEQHKKNVVYHYKLHKFFIRNFAWVLALFVMAALVLLGVKLHDNCTVSSPENMCSEEGMNAIYHEYYPHMMKAWDANGGIDNYQALFVADVKHGMKNIIFSPPQLKKININIALDEFNGLKAQRESALEKGVFFNEDQEGNFKAKLDYRGQKLSAKIRLKGKLKDHWIDSKKWSLRVTVKDGNLDGLTRFSIQHPKTRNYHYKELIQHISEVMGVMHPKTFFAKVLINGDSIGIMEIEEHFDSQTPAIHQRPSGFLFKQEGEDAGGYSHSSPEGTFFNNTLFYQLNDVDRVNTQLYKKQKDDYWLALGLFKEFTIGNMPASDVFDIENIAKSLAVISFFNAPHALVPGNLYFYFNPVTKKFEIIPNEYEAATTMYEFMRIANLGYYDYVVWLDVFEKIVTDPLFHVAFKTHSQKLTDYVNNNSKALNDSSEESLKVLRKEFHFLPRIPIEALIKDQNKKMELIKAGAFFNHSKTPVYIADRIKELEKINFNKPTPLNKKIALYLERTGSGVKIEIFNRLPQDTILGTFYTGVNCIRGSDTHKPEAPSRDSCEVVRAHGITLPPGAEIKNTANIFHLVQPLKSASRTVVIPDVNEGDTFHLFLPHPSDETTFVEGVILVSDDHILQMTPAFPYKNFPNPPSIDAHPLKADSLDALLTTYPFLTYDEVAKIVHVAAGEWALDAFVILPVGVGLHVSEGTHITFAKEAGILLKGRLEINGSADKIVVLKAANPEEGWRGVTVLQANNAEDAEPSLVQHTIFENTKYAQHKAWITTGGVTFYESDVNLTHTVFEGSQAEDALNIVRSHFSLEHLDFRNVRSDAFDADFTKGSITQSSFDNIGGDGIDFSGSDITADHLKFSNVHDKAISVGEASQFKGNHMYVTNSGTGVASKDGSQSIIENATFDNIAQAAMMAYIKKSEYGGGKIFAQNIKFESHENAIVAQKKSFISIDGIEIKTRKINIDKLYKSGYMKK